MLPDTVEVTAGLTPYSEQVSLIVLIAVNRLAVIPARSMVCQ